MANTQFVLFGGGGYIGQHLAIHLLDRGHEVVIVDQRAPSVDYLRGYYQSVDSDILFRADAKFVHLACPSNHREHWDMHRAEMALDAGLHLAERTSGTKLLVSSLSVYDVPDNQYAMLKRMAERIVRPQGWQIARLGTVLGAIPPCPYRADLGLHRIARTIVLDIVSAQPWVSSTMCRNVTTIERVVRGIYMQLINPSSSGQTTQYTNGVVRYADIVPPDVALCPGQEPEHIAGYGLPANETQLRELRTTFNQLVADIRAGRTHAI